MADSRQRVGLTGLVFEEADQVAGGGHAGALHLGIFAAIDHVVDLARLEPSLERNRGWIGKVPPVARDLFGLIQPVSANRHAVLFALKLQNRIGNMSPIAERGPLGGLAKDDVGTYEAGQRLTTICSDGRVKLEQSLSFSRNIPLPAHPDDAEPVAHEKRVAKIIFRDRVQRSGSIEVIKDDSLSASVGHLVEQASIAFFQIHRLEDVEIGGELHLSLGVTMGELQIHDRLVLGQGRIQGEVRFASELFVSPGQAKRLPIKDELPALHFEPRHMSFRHGDYHQSHENSKCSCCPYCSSLHFVASVV